jgi:hypothetical protein
MVTLSISGCNRVDAQKFEPLHRVGKAVEVDIESPTAIHPTESERLFRLLRTEIAALEGRTRSDGEDAALQAYANAAEAYRRLLDIREIETQGNARDGRVLLGEGWSAVASKFNFAAEPGPSLSEDKNKWYWINTTDAIGALRTALKESLTKAEGLVNGQ